MLKIAPSFSKLFNPSFFSSVTLKWHLQIFARTMTKIRTIRIHLDSKYPCMDWKDIFLSKPDPKFSFEDQYKEIFGVNVHEIYHFLYTPEDEYKGAIDSFVLDPTTKLKDPYVQEVYSQFLNSIEDGFIEFKGGVDYPQFKALLDWSNFNVINQVVELSGDKVEQYQRLVLYYALTRIDFADNFCKDDEVKDRFSKILPIIDGLYDYDADFDHRKIITDEVVRNVSDWIEENRKKQQNMNFQQKSSSPNSNNSGNGTPQQQYHSTTVTKPVPNPKGNHVPTPNDPPSLQNDLSKLKEKFGNELDKLQKGHSHLQQQGQIASTYVDGFDFTIQKPTGQRFKLKPDPVAVATMVEEFRHMLVDSPIVVRNRMMGKKLDIRNVMNPTKFEVFMKKVDVEQEFEPSIMIMMDLSGSTGDILQYYAEIIGILYEFCKECSIPLAIVGHNVPPNNNDIRLHMIKDFSSDLQSDEIEIPCGGNTREDSSLLWGAHYLAQQPTRDKILFMLSDGVPMHSYNGQVFSGDDAVKALRKVENEITNLDIEMLGVGIGVDLSKFYTHSVFAQSGRDLSKKIFSYIKERMRGY